MYVTGFSAFIISSVIAVIANYRLRHMQKLPMQWGLSAQVNWTAPRAIALAFFPVLYALIAAFIIFTGINGHAVITIRSLLIFSTIMIGTQLLHLLMITKTTGS